MPLSPTPADPGLQDLIQQMKVDLAGRLSVPVEEISVMEVSEVEWADSSLDCPEPGMSYLQVITPGYRVVLQANDQSHEYHASRDAYFIYCENREFPPAPKP